jgi:hypothetical protein
MVEFWWLPKGNIHHLSFDTLLDRSEDGPNFKHYSYEGLFPKGATDLTLRITVNGKTMARSLSLA